MKAIAVSVNERTLSFIREGGVVVEEVSLSGTEELIDWVRDGLYEVLIVDLDDSGLGTFFPRVIRKQGISIPIVGISCGAEDVPWSESRADFLEQGGDELIKGPGNPREILASLRSVSRRFKGSMTDIVSFTAEGMSLKVNMAQKQVILNGDFVHLTNQESIMLLALAEHAGRILSKESLLTALYPNEADEAEIKIIDVFICKIRKKLSTLHPGSGDFIQTVWGRGYTLSEIFQAYPMRKAV